MEIEGRMLQGRKKRKGVGGEKGRKEERNNFLAKNVHLLAKKRGKSRRKIRNHLRHSVVRILYSKGGEGGAWMD